MTETHPLTLLVGGVHVHRHEAMDHARSYLTRGSSWGYPSYDGFDSAHALGPLNDADLLAPVLLNIGRAYGPSLYEALQAAVPTLQAGLDRIPHSWRLHDADDEQLEVLGELFSILDGQGIPGARGTVLAKVLHRKRPRFIPLYDAQVWRTYCGTTDPAVRPVKGRTWREFMPLLARAVADDLVREVDFWASLVALAPGPEITDVRALDIVAWWAGRQAAAAARLPESCQE